MAGREPTKTQQKVDPLCAATEPPVSTDWSAEDLRAVLAAAAGEDVLLTVLLLPV